MCRRVGVVVSLAVVLVLVGCVTPERRIADNPAMFHALPPAQRGLVRQGLIMEGMTKDAVFLAWGVPDRYSESVADGERRETWLYIGYRNEEIPGYAWRPYRGIYCDPYYDAFAYRPARVSVPYLYRSVTFEDGRVVAYEAPVRGRL